MVIWNNNPWGTASGSGDDGYDILNDPMSLLGRLMRGTTGASPMPGIGWPAGSSLGAPPLPSPIGNDPGFRSPRGMMGTGEVNDPGFRPAGGISDAYYRGAMRQMAPPPTTSLLDRFMQQPASAADPILFAASSSSGNAGNGAVDSSRATSQQPVRRSHSGAILTDPDALPDAYKNYLRGLRWANPTGGSLRGRDGAGNGSFGAPRSDGTPHGAADWVNSAGQTVVSPVDGRVRGTFNYNGLPAVSIDAGNGIQVDALYTSSNLKQGAKISAGDSLGTAVDIHPRYGSRITNHTHIQIKIPSLNAVVDPTNLIPHEPDAK